MITRFCFLGNLKEVELAIGVYIFMCFFFFFLLYCLLLIPAWIVVNRDSASCLLFCSLLGSLLSSIC